MALRLLTLCATLLAFKASSTRAQTQDRAQNAGTAQALSQSAKLSIAASDCKPYAFDNKLASFNYTAKLGVQKLPAGCEKSSIRITKQYTIGSCPETRANNYNVPALKITNKCTDRLQTITKSTCANVFKKAPNSAFAPDLIGAGDTIDAGNVCWAAPKLFYFVENGCTAPVSIVIKLTRDVYNGDCTDAGDTDDGGDDVGGPANSVASEQSSSGGGGSGGGGSKLSSGAKAGIAIGVIAGVIIIALAVYFLCCQLGKQT